MHEFALADAVVRAAVKTADDEELQKVDHVQVRVGELQSIKKETFDFALKESRPADDPRLEETTFEVVIVPAAFRCRVCDHAFVLADCGERDPDAAEAIHFVPELAHAFMRCPSCGSPDFEVTEGRGVEIGTIQGERA